MPAPPFPATSSDKLNMPHRTRRRCRPPTDGILCVAYVAAAQLQCCTAFWALPQPSMMSVRQSQVIRFLPDTSQTATTAAVGRGGRSVLSCCSLGCGRFSTSSRRGGRENDIKTRRLVGGGGLRCSVPSSGELLVSDVAEPAGSDEVRVSYCDNIDMIDDIIILQYHVNINSRFFKSHVFRKVTNCSMVAPISTAIPQQS